MAELLPAAASNRCALNSMARGNNYAASRVACAQQHRPHLGGIIGRAEKLCHNRARAAQRPAWPVMAWRNVEARLFNICRINMLVWRHNAVALRAAAPWLGDGNATAK